MKRNYTSVSFFFQTTRTDQKSFTKFYEILRCQIEPFGLGNITKKIVPFFSVKYNTGRD